MSITEPAVSPRLAVLRQALQSGDTKAFNAFWQEVVEQGTPLIESLEEDPDYSLVTFLWRAGETCDALPDACRPHTAAEGYAAQAQLPGVAGRELLGWKIAATSLAGQAHIQVAGPLAGRLLSGQVTGDGATLSLAGNRMRVAEPEFCFRMARDLPPRATPYAQDEVMAAVGINDVSHFVRDFRSATGQFPVEYRARVRKQAAANVRYSADAKSGQ